MHLPEQVRIQLGQQLLQRRADQDFAVAQITRTYLSAASK
jgi:hypothetical protein